MSCMIKKLSTDKRKKTEQCFLTSLPFFVFCAVPNSFSLYEFITSLVCLTDAHARPQLHWKPPKPNG